MKILSRSDEILMLAILRLKNNAYGVPILQEIYQQADKKLTLGSLWVSLDILFKRKLVDKRMADPTPQRGGRSKIYYTLTPAGIIVLERTREFQASLWRGIPAKIQ